jgi:hypothetical protein
MRLRHAAARGLLLLFLDVCHKSFGGEHQTGDRSGTLQSEARHSGWLDYARLAQGLMLTQTEIVPKILPPFRGHFICRQLRGLVSLSV